MAKQMHQIDDDENPGKGGFFHGFEDSESEQKPTASLQPEEKADHTRENNSAEQGSGDGELGMGRKNPFENWNISSTRSEKTEETAFERPKSDKGLGFVIWHTLSTVILAGIITATLFSLWMPANFIPGGLDQKLADAVAVDNLAEQTAIAEGVLPANFPTRRIGIVVGHRGHDSGAVCANGLTELEINSNVATYVQQKLIDLGYEVDLLDEFDARLANYEAGLLLSIHSDSCDYINDSATGFKVAAAFSQKMDKSSTRLVACVADRYAKLTGLRYHYQSVTTDMTQYHVFDEISPYTTAGIIELGFMNLDQEILTTRPELLADGIVQGIQCYMNNKEVDQP